MNYSLVVKEDQSPSGIAELQRSRGRHRQQKVRTRTLNEKHTSPKRSALACIFTNLSMLPFTIHSETITNRVPSIVTPNSGSTFG